MVAALCAFLAVARSGSSVLVWEMVLAEKLSGIIDVGNEDLCAIPSTRLLIIVFKVSRLNTVLITGLAVLGHCHYCCY
jgi:hypothetical protein